jgi:hypothetical protein
MKKIIALLKDIVRDPGSYIALIVLVLLVVGAVYVIATSSAANWRYLYCQSSEAHAIECTVKGWW